MRQTPIIRTTSVADPDPYKNDTDPPLLCVIHNTLSLAMLVFYILRNVVRVMFVREVSVLFHFRIQIFLTDPVNFSLRSTFSKEKINEIKNILKCSLFLSRHLYTS